jgi:hypothetical protein
MESPVSNYIQIWKKNVQNTDKIPFTSISKVCLSTALIFMKLTTAGWHHVELITQISQEMCKLNLEINLSP